MKKISTSIYTFADLIGYGCLYVDKTEYIYRMATDPGECLPFLAPAGSERA